VQGVGFRPFVYALATGLGLTGLVGNDLDGVFAEVEGPQAAVAEFLRRLERDAPPLARIERVAARDVPPRHEPGFIIAASDSQTGLRRTLIARPPNSSATAGSSPSRAWAGTTWPPAAAPSASAATRFAHQYDDLNFLRG